jgi:trehalose 6-phosphate synthase
MEKLVIDTPEKMLDLSESIGSRRILLISNRPAYTLRGKKGKVDLVRGTGGLVTALDPVMKKSGGIWFGLERDDKKSPARTAKVEGDVPGTPGYQINYIPIDSKNIEGFYRAISNRTLWPLFHCFLGHTHFEVEHWRTYLHVNWRVYQSIIGKIRENDLVWVHDYHFIPLPKLLRRSTKKFGIGYFLHIPFPPPDILRALPWYVEVLEGLLGADIIGFHTMGYLRNFLDCAEFILGSEVDRDNSEINYGGRRVKCGAFPISIDFERFKETALSAQTAQRVQGIRKAFGVEHIAMGVDRLDYTKGVLERLLAVEKLLERYPDIRGNFVFIQLTVPSRENVAEYRSMRRTIDEIVGRINGRFAEGGWVPIHYYYRSLKFENLVAYYRASDLGVVTPLKDGMNLVAKEYVVSKHGMPGSLVLSELAGAADELLEAHIVNPNDIDMIADTMYKVLNLSERARSQHIDRLNRRIKDHDIYAWLNSFLGEWGKMIG